MKNFLGRKRNALALLTLIVSAGIAAMSAYAWFDVSATGTSPLTTAAGTTGMVSIVNDPGSGCSYTNTAPYTLCISQIPSTLAPGGVVPVTANVFVPGGGTTPNFYLGHLSDTFTVPSGCSASDFHFNSSSAPAQTSVSGSISWTQPHVSATATNYSSTGYIHMDDNGTDQSSCESKGITVNWTLGP